MPYQKTTRQRFIEPPPDLAGKISGYQVSNGIKRSLSQTGAFNVAKGTQVTVSEGHPFKSHKGTFKGDVGGDFYSQKKYVKGITRAGLSVTVSDFNPNGTYLHYDGAILPFAVTPTSPSFPNPNSSSGSQLDALGATAIARCKPTNSVANASTALGELLKDGLPKLIGVQTWKARNQAARNAGHEFLNAEFGWNPLVSDVRSFGQAVRNAGTVINQFKRDAGRIVRRRYTFPMYHSVTENINTDLGNHVINPVNSNFASQLTAGPLVTTTTVERRQWFSGAFTYGIPKGNSALSKLERNYLLAGKLLGTTLTPDTLWNLAPWSWAVDWFSNMGDVISNMSDWAVYGLVMRYGYVMEHTITTVTYTRLTDLSKKDVQRGSSISFVTETKQRKGAHPFGFGISWDGLAPVQYAILGALGLTRH